MDNDFDHMQEDSGFIILVLFYIRNQEYIINIGYKFALICCLMGHLTFNAISIDFRYEQNQEVCLLQVKLLN